MKEIDLVIKNGTIVTSTELVTADLSISGGKIVAITRGSHTPEGESVIDASNKILLPGAVDGHTHVYSPPWCFDSFDSGTKAAAYGGTTTIVEMPLVNDEENTTDVKTFLKKKEIGEKEARVDFALYAGEIRREDELGEIAELAEQGCAGFKITLGGETAVVNDGVLWEAITRIAQVGSVSTFHSENHQLLQYFYKKMENSIKRGEIVNFADSRPEVVCVDTTQKVILYNKYVGNRTHIAHMSTKAERDLVWEAKRLGQQVTAEVCPHHLLFNRKSYDSAEARYYVMNPALKTLEDQEALWQGLANGAVDMVVTDHAAYTRKEKDHGKDNVLKSWAGVAGLEFSYRLLINYGVLKNRFGWSRLVQVMAENPAKLFGLFPQKGVLNVGSDADIVVYDPKGSRQLSDKDLRCVADYTIYEGIRIKGDIDQVLVRGKTVAENHEVIGEPGFGEFVAGHPIKNLTS